MTAKPTKEETAKTEVKAPETPKTTSEKVPPKTRWVKNAFFNGGTTKYVRLDELHNHLNDNHFGQGDTTDEELATEIMRRAGMVEHPKHDEIRDALRDFFEMIPDPAMKWINPNYGKHYPKAIQPK